jgi:hypothetical protein
MLYAVLGAACLPIACADCLIVQICLGSCIVSCTATIWPFRLLLQRLAAASHANHCRVGAACPPNERADCCIVQLCQLHPPHMLSVAGGSVSLLLCHGRSQYRQHLFTLHDPYYTSVLWQIPVSAALV